MSPQQNKMVSALSKATDSRRRRWWQPVALGLALTASLLALSAFTFRQIGFAKLNAVQARIAADGEPSTLGEYLRTIQVDPQLQKEYWMWQEGFSWENALPNDTEALVWHWLLAKDPIPFPPKLDASLQRNEDYFSTGRSLLRRPGLVVTQLGYIATDCNENSSIEEVEGSRFPSFAVRREFARWLAVQVARSDRTTMHLEDLDRLVRANELGGSAEATAIAGYRDTAYAWAAIRGNIDADTVRRWATGEVTNSSFLYQERQDARCLVWDPLRRSKAPSRDQLLTDETSWTHRSWGSWYWWAGSTADRAWHWMALPHDIARGTERLWEAERRLRGDDSDTAEDAHGNQALLTSYGRRLFELSKPKKHARVQILNLQSRARRRATFLIYALLHSDTPLPEDNAEFHKRWQQATLGMRASEPELFYRRLGPRHGRISSSPDTAGIPARRNEFSNLIATVDSGEGVEFYVPPWLERKRHRVPESE